MKMLHNFLNFLPFIILPFRGNEQRRGKEKKTRHHREGKNFHLCRRRSSLAWKMFFLENRSFFFLKSDYSVRMRANGEDEKLTLTCIFRDFLHFPAWKFVPSLCAWRMHHIKMVKSSTSREKRRKMIEKLTYGWSGWDIIYRTDAFGINFSPEIQQTPVYMRQPTTIGKHMKIDKFLKKKRSCND